MNGTSTNEWNFVIAAYSVAWTVIVGYAIYLMRAVKRARALAAQATARGGVT